VKVLKTGRQVDHLMVQPRARVLCEPQPPAPPPSRAAAAGTSALSRKSHATTCIRAVFFRAKDSTLKAAKENRRLKVMLSRYSGGSRK